MNTLRLMSKVPLLRGAIVIFVVALLSVTAYVPKAQGVGGSCSGIDVHPSQGLRRAAEEAPAGRTFCVHDGTYKVSQSIRVQSGDVFMGVYSDTTRPSVTTDRAHHVFNADFSDGATVKNLTVSGAVGNDRCEPDCGRGIGGGKNLTVENVRATHNMNQGIGGTASGLLVRDSTMDHNGSRSFTQLDGGPTSAAGIKAVSSATVIDSQFYDNWWDGVWCDGCESFRVENSTATHNGKAGIAYEFTKGPAVGPAVITGNMIKRNGWNDAVPRARRKGGLLIVDSTNANVFGNIFDRNVPYGIDVGDTPRLPTIGGISIHDNTMNGDRLHGCSLSGVTCDANN
jgi:hypothetical protein